MKKIIILFLLSFILLFSACDINQFLKKDNVNIDTINHISTVIVNSNLKVSTTTREKTFPYLPGPYQASGSSVIFEKLGNTYYLLTNKHVINLAENLHHIYTIEDNYHNTYSADLVQVSTVYDLAILKFESTNDYGIIPLAKENPKVGDIVFSVGSPYGQHNIITAGNVIEYKTIDNVDYEIIIHDAIIRHGSSGSMLINEKYEIVGLNTWGFSSEQGTDEGYVIGGAISVENIRDFIKQEQEDN